MHSRRRRLLGVAAAAVAMGAGTGAGLRQTRPAVLGLWAAGQPAFGIFVPNENPGRRGRAANPASTPVGPSYTAAGAERLAANPLYDFLFLNLEGAYDAAHIRAVVDGLGRGGDGHRPALLVRIPSIADAGVETTAARVKEALALGANGVTLPHIRHLDDARQAIGFFQAAGTNVWSPANPSGDTIAMLMLEDPAAVSEAPAIADLGGYSILACGIGSLRGALGGDRDGAEAGVAHVLAESKRTGLVNMLTASSADVEARLTQGFLALLMQGAGADEAIRLGRAAAGRSNHAPVNDAR